MTRGEDWEYLAFSLTRGLDFGQVPGGLNEKRADWRFFELSTADKGWTQYFHVCHIFELKVDHSRQSVGNLGRTKEGDI